MRSPIRVGFPTLRVWLSACCAGAVATLLLFIHPAVAAPATLVVGPGGSHASLADALAAAAPGDTVRVVGGVHPGPVVIDRPLTLVGESGPVITGAGQGTVVTITAPGVHLSGFTVRGSGSVLEHEDTGIAVNQAPGTVLRANRVEDALFGIYVRQSHNTRIVDNTVLGKHLPEPRRGDAIKVWYSHNLELAGNTVQGGRDVIVWFSNGATVQDNRISGSRYGLHFMFSSQATVVRNVLRQNTIGAYFMNGAGFVVQGNAFLEHRGNSGYGVGLKDIDDVDLADNVFAANRIGIYMDNSPISQGVRNRIAGNLFVGNHAGVAQLPSVKNNDFTGNGFVENQEQWSILGRGNALGNRFSVGGQGNYWSDYAGYDADGDGRGDLPYRAQSLFERLLDAHPDFRWFLYSPAAAAVDLAAKAFPAIAPEPKLADPTPAMRPPVPAAALNLPVPSGAPLLALGLGLLVLAAVVLALGSGRRLGLRAAGTGGASLGTPAWKEDAL